jgi:hypothetical protein
MAVKARVTEIVQALMTAPDHTESFYNRRTGAVLTVRSALVRRADDFGFEPWPELNEEKRREWDEVKRILSTRSVLPLPKRFTLRQWKIMIDFAHSLSSREVRRQLLEILELPEYRPVQTPPKTKLTEKKARLLHRWNHHITGFNRFSSAVRRLELEPAWREFRASALREIAIEWCKENHIVWE